MAPNQEPESARILVVDDDPSAAARVVAILRPLGHRVTVAHGWTEALRTFDPTNTDLVLMDAVMPNVDGLKLTRLLREQSQSYVPTVFLTGLSGAELREQCIDAGADDFLTKPVDPIELRVRLKAMLRIRALTKALEAKTQELERAARTDPLTGVGNRRVFDERLLAEIERTLSMSDDILVIDVPASAGHLRHWLYENTEVLARDAGDDGIERFRIRLERSKRGRLEGRLQEAGLRLGAASSN